MVKPKNKSNLQITKLVPKSRFNRASMLAAVILVVGVGSFVVYRSMAAGANSNDERIQYKRLSETREARGLGNLKAAVCMRDQARAWSKTMSAAGKIYHDGNNTAKFTQRCGPGWIWMGENVGRVGPGCPNSTCSNAVYQGFVDSPGHFANLVSTQPNYVGIGSYIGDDGLLYITQIFAKCACSPATYAPYWDLRSKATASSAISARAEQIEVKRGQVITFYNNIVNDGPYTATYPKWTTKARYWPNGSKISSSRINDGTISTKPGAVYTYSYNVTVPTNASIGEKFCTSISYGLADGPGTAGSHSIVSCAKVVQ